MDYSNYYPQNQHQVVQAAAYDPSQPSQTYDPSTATTAGAAQPSSYYYYDAQSQQYASYNPSQDYAGYYYPQHHQQQLQESSQQQQTQAIQQYGQAPHELYYPQPGQNPGFEFSQNVGGMPQHPISHPTGHFPTRGRGRGGGRRGGRSSRGGRGNLGNRQDSAMASTVPNSAIPPPKLPRMEWCELCRVECNTAEIMEQHRKGKRHMKNLKVHEELLNLKQAPTTVVEPVPVEANEQGTGATAAADKPQATETESSVPKDEEKSTNERVLGKRKMKSGRGGKITRTAGGLKRHVEPPPPKKPAISYICELCNAKCETQVVLDSHMTGKKHLANLKKAQSHGGYTEAAGLKVVYPSASIIPPSSATATSTTLLAPHPPPQQGAAELGALLAAHGVASDESQALLAQLIMNYVVTQTQGGGALPQPAIPVPNAGGSHLPYSISEPYVGAGVGVDCAVGTTVMNPSGAGTVAVASSEQAASLISGSHAATVIETEMKPPGTS